MGEILNSALARIGWQGRDNTLGVELVNRNRERFFLYAEPFICMMLHNDDYWIVKHRDLNPEKAIVHHAGAIWGDIEVEGRLATITLHFGAVNKDIVYDPKREGLLHAIGNQQYQLSSKLLKSLAKEVERVRVEQQDFNRLQMEAECTPLQASFFSAG